MYFEGGDAFEFDESQREYDQNSHQWEIELTNYKTSHEKVAETPPTWSSDDTYRIIAILLQSSAIIAHIISWKPKEDII